MASFVCKIACRSVLSSVILLVLSHPHSTKWLPLADDISGCVFVNEKFCILITISPKFVPKDSIDNNWFRRWLGTE